MTPAAGPSPTNGRSGRRFHLWPWALAGVFLLFLAIQAFLIWKVSRRFEGPDDMQYYRHGLEYGKVIQRQARQRELGWTVRTNLPETVPADAPFSLEVTPRDAAGVALAGGRVEVKVGRPATQRDDRRLDLAESPAGVYRGSVALAPGTWEFQLTLSHGGETLVERVRVRAGPP